MSLLSPEISRIKAALSDLETNINSMAAMGKFNKLKAVELENKNLKKELNKANRSQAQYKSLYEKKAKEVLRLESLIKILENRLK